MFVTTFYSFKGGVGRTMALANVAVDLAQSGRRVLVVDFDLEAPGLDTLDLPKPPGTYPGVVDYVTDYLASEESPDIANYVYESVSVGRAGGRLYVMPAGARDAEYSNRLTAIDWARLYSEHDGYLMFEDLKAQWKSYLAPDYVLIDSRTGHTDVSGICTRQLPDAVLVFFIPNEQNLKGLERIVPAIRAEAHTEPQKAIDLLFVMSNVPDLDDEEDILAARRKQFAESLQIDVRQRLHIIHRYDSLHLLNQAIFTKDKPRSRLAHEYQHLTRRLMSMNPEDKEGALTFLRQLRKGRSRMSPREAERQLEQITARHPEDAAIRHELAGLRKEQGRLLDAAQLLEGIVRLGKADSEMLVERAALLQQLGRTEEITADVLQALSDVSLDVYSLDRAVRLLSAVDESRLAGLGKLPAVAAQPAEMRLWIGQKLRRSAAELKAGAELFRSIVDDERTPEGVVHSARSELAFNYIGLRESVRALDAIATNTEKLAEQSLVDRFNGAMARWAIEGTHSRDAFARVLEGVSPNDWQSPSANYLQCFALSQWAVGRPDEARQLAYRARSAATLTVGSHISCWRYLEVSSDLFLDDLERFLAFIDGDGPGPLVLGFVQERPVQVP